MAATRARRVLIVADAITSKGESDEKNPWKFFVDRCEGDFFADLPLGEMMSAKPKTSVSAAELYESSENILTDSVSENSSYAILRPSQIKLKGKTDADAHDLDTKYQEQLSAYVEAFRELTGHTAKPMLYHIDV